MQFKAHLSYVSRYASLYELPVLVTNAVKVQYSAYGTSIYADAIVKNSKFINFIILDIVNN